LGHSKKLGILLYGAPGCGKSSIIQAISTYFNKDVYLANIQDDYNSVEYYLRCVSVGVPEKSIIVYEDFDCIASIKSRDEEKKSDQYDENILPKLLQQFDGLGLPDRTIIIATTNYLDKIDDAAKRDGRFDIKLEITPATKETALKMAEYFGIENKSVLDALSFPCPQATVQKVLLDTLKNENKL
jgi:chaperone BCS1